MAGNASAEDARWPRKWRRDIPAGTIRRSDIGRKPPIKPRLEAGSIRGDAAESHRRHFPCIHPVDRSFSVVQDEFVGVEQGPEHVLEDVDRVGVSTEEPV